MWAENNKTPAKHRDIFRFSLLRVCQAETLPTALPSNSNSQVTNSQVKSVVRNSEDPGCHAMARHP